MTQTTGEMPSQEKIFEITDKVNRIVKHPIIDAVLEASERTFGIGWGAKEYRAGRGVLSSQLQHPEDTPAEIHFYPEVDDIDVDGAIYWHGKDSHALERGELLSMHFDDTVEDGHYTSHLEIRLRNQRLEIGRPEPGRGANTKLLPPDPEVVRMAELSLDKLLIYIEQQETSAASPSL